MIFEKEADPPSQWAAFEAITSKIGCTPETFTQLDSTAWRDVGCH